MLTDHQLRGVRMTGAWAMPLMAFGFTVAVLPVAGLLIVIVFSAVLGLVTGGLAGGLLIGFIATLFGGAAVVQNPLFVIVPIIAGALAFWGGSWGSVRRMRKLGIASPRRSMWAAFGLGLATQVIVAVVVGVLLLIVFGLFTTEPVPLFITGSPDLSDGPAVAHEAIFHAAMVATAAASGALYWPIFAQTSARRALAQSDKKQQEQYAAEWAAYEWAAYEWAAHEWAAREREHPANRINSSEHGRPENNGGACET